MHELPAVFLQIDNDFETTAADDEQLRGARLLLPEEHQVECDASAAYEAYRARGVMKDGRRFGRPPDPVPAA
jgi:hypothetical protein